MHISNPRHEGLRAETARVEPSPSSSYRASCSPRARRGWGCSTEIAAVCPTHAPPADGGGQGAATYCRPRRAVGDGDAASRLTTPLSARPLGAAGRQQPMMAQLTSRRLTSGLPYHRARCHPVFVDRLWPRQMDGRTERPLLFPSSRPSPRPTRRYLPLRRACTQLFDESQSCKRLGHYLTPILCFNL